MNFKEYSKKIKADEQDLIDKLSTIMRDAKADRLAREAIANGTYRTTKEIVNELKERIMTNTINFYSTQGKYGCFSNFSRHAILLDGKTWQTSEHYFQAQKFVGTEYETLVQNAVSPREAADLGRRRDWPLRADWDEVKDDIMRKVVRCKFTQLPELTEILLSTKDAILVEHTVNDKYWGDGGDGSGKNMLGKILMEVRTELYNAIQLEEVREDIFDGRYLKG